MTPEQLVQLAVDARWRVAHADRMLEMLDERTHLQLAHDAKLREFLHPYRDWHLALAEAIGWIANPTSRRRSRHSYSQLNPTC